MSSFAQPTSDAVPIWLVAAGEWETVKETLGEEAAAFAEACGFKPKPGRLQLLPGEDGRLAGVLFGVEAAGVLTRDPLAAGKLATSLPEGVYRFANPPTDAGLAALGFLMALYRYDRFKPDPRRSRSSSRPTGWTPAGSSGSPRRSPSDATSSTRRPTCSAPMRSNRRRRSSRSRFDASVAHGARRGLVAANFPLVHAVGRAAAEPPRIVDFVWGREDAPKVTLVGKGVTFDSGGLDIKPASGMELMKKDMGGAATALTLARLVMESGLDVRLRVITPIVENAISGPAMRPGDVIVSRKGLAVEIGNTDAEGRLILADALALADEEAPELLIDFATLTGAARVALGPDLPPFYTDDDALAAAIAGHAARARDPLWRMPLWRPYDAMIDGTIGDVSNSGTGAGQAGSITAALFLRRFVEKARHGSHFDVYAWNPKARAHGPAGGEIQAARALFDLLSERYARR